MQESRTMMIGVLALAAIAFSPPNFQAFAADKPDAGAAADVTAEQPFIAGNAAAMEKMMADMAIRPSGDVDRDFVAMMVPHHQGAIDMAKLQLLYGRNQKLKYLAQEIIVTQQQEIAAMRLAVGEPLPAAQPSPSSLPSPDASSEPMSAMMSSMSPAPHHHAP